MHLVCHATQSCKSVCMHVCSTCPTSSLCNYIWLMKQQKTSTQYKKERLSITQRVWAKMFGALSLNFSLFAPYAYFNCRSSLVGCNFFSNLFSHAISATRSFWLCKQMHLYFPKMFIYTFCVCVLGSACLCIPRYEQTTHIKTGWFCNTLQRRRLVNFIFLY